MATYQYLNLSVICGVVCQLCVVLVGGNGTEQDERVPLAHCWRPVFSVCFQSLSEPVSNGEYDSMQSVYVEMTLVDSWRNYETLKSPHDNDCSLVVALQLHMTVGVDELVLVAASLAVAVATAATATSSTPWLWLFVSMGFISQVCVTCYWPVIVAK